MDPLAQLHDIILPPEIGLWPLAWGWWLLLALVLTSVVLILGFWRRKTKRNAYRKQALAELDALYRGYQLAPNASAYLQGLAVLLRRAALAAHPKTFPKDIQGQAWLAWLDHHCPQVAHGFSQGPGQALLTGPYQAAPEVDIAALHALARTWLTHHRNHWQAAKPTVAAARTSQEPANA